MSNIKKTRISVFPIFSLEVTVGTFLDYSKQEFVPMEISKKGISEKYAQNVFGDWCFPLKLGVAMCEQVVVEEKVEKIISINVNTCKYPLVMGNMNKWIKKEFEYYPINSNSFYPDAIFLQSLFSQLQKINPSINKAEMIRRIPFGITRIEISKKLVNAYFKNLPINKDPKELKNVFREAKLLLIRAETIEKAEKSLSDFLNYVKKTKEKKSPRYKILVTGDFTTMLLEFPIFDLDIFLGKNGVELVNPPFPSNYYEQRYSTHSRKAREMLSNEFSNKHNKIKVEDKHFFEILTLYKVLKGVDSEIDGIIFIKPLMCAPCDNVSYIVKKHEHFNLPYLEISYDEHSGINCIVTRLEAFLNILDETTKKRK